VPTEQKPPTDRELKIQEEMAKRQAQAATADKPAQAARTLAELTEEYNALDKAIDDLEGQVAEKKIQRDAVDALIRKGIDGLESDGIKLNGFTWSEKCEPYAICEDPSKIVEYLKTNDMESALALKNSELIDRIKTIVREEAENNELLIEEKELTDPATGETYTVQEVRSHVPGVRVFLKHGLSRVKSKK
jgi:hypothetical protein